MGDNLKVVWAEFSTLKIGCFDFTNLVSFDTHAHIDVKTRPRLCPASSSLSMFFELFNLSLGVRLL